LASNSYIFALAQVSSNPRGWLNARKNIPSQPPLSMRLVQNARQGDWIPKIAWRQNLAMIETPNSLPNT
jgi:hypothetical protein